MKKNNLKTIAILALTFIAFGCKKITNINTSPNNPPLSAATPQVLFPSAVASSAGRIGGELQILGGFWSQYYTQYTTANQFRNIDSYNLTQNDLNANWNELFQGALEDYQLSITQAKAKGLNNYVLMSTCMKAYTYGVLVDLYDQVPYTQALQGATVTQPVFDKGHDVYLGLIKEIDAALAANYNVNLAGADAATDFLFNGDMTKWAQFANTLELKLYLRMVNAYPADAQAGVTKLFANGLGFLNVDAGIPSSTFSNTPNKDNPFFEYNQRSLNTTTNIKASTTFLLYLTTTEDPRITPLFGPSPVVGINQGDYNGSDATYAKATNPAQSPTDPVWFISAAESHFLQAEAIVRYGVAGNAAAEYVAGVSASFAANGLSASDGATFAATSAVAFPAAGTTDAKIGAIIMQKWVANAQGCHALESFFDQQRTGYPKNSAVYTTNANYVPGEWVYSLNGVTVGKAFPKRLIFPESEYTTNKNTPTLVPLTTPVWWGIGGSK
ncbi:SusD/RagB family nutrient-binding outer membrane lipoprotein [Mucilaginibacter corticis]|uniref:SusD/RagB family nutrient-binding outer membrane lipoprotein n=1 Tax=Mucilaginibacter corticis TaxID=2597670 RepID=A0A556MTX9_9SPHI|nr:SusD/RagB family nutrient-binding outer membrane lipoprotein [Mucilaginibacter corticis]TSJ43269.1 SusD/RagB family nutrient-binding outer membrane lipoprotein [Mucilaginibacter corticis]